MRSASVAVLLAVVALQNVGCATGRAEDATQSTNTMNAALAGDYRGYRLPPDVTRQIAESKSPLRRELEPVTSYLASRIGESGVPQLSVRDREYVQHFVKSAPESHRPYVRFVFSNPAGRIRDLLVLDAGTSASVGTAASGRVERNRMHTHAGLRVLNGPCYVYYDPVEGEVNTLPPDAPCL